MENVTGFPLAPPFAAGNVGTPYDSGVGRGRGECDGLPGDGPRHPLRREWNSPVDARRTSCADPDNTHDQNARDGRSAENAPDAVTEPSSNASCHPVAPLLASSCWGSLRDQEASARCAFVHPLSDSATRLTRRVPWLCVPSSRRVCLCRRPPSSTPNSTHRKLFASPVQRVSGVLTGHFTVLTPQLSSHCPPNRPLHALVHVDVSCPRDRPSVGGRIALLRTLARAWPDISRSVWHAANSASRT